MFVRLETAKLIAIAKLHFVAEITATLYTDKGHTDYNTGQDHQHRWSTNTMQDLTKTREIPRAPNPTNPRLQGTIKNKNNNQDQNKNQNHRL